MKTLRNLKVLGLDCQATHANPSKGHLLEIGWAFAAASDTSELEPTNVRTFLLEVPRREIPSTMSRVTGIVPDDLRQASSPACVWKLLVKDTKQIGVQHQATAAIHFSQFETPHLHYLCQKVHGTDTLPFQILCTHQIVKRLLPYLP